MEKTYRVVAIGDRQYVGPTAATIELAKLAATDMPRRLRLGIECTEWEQYGDRMRGTRTVLIAAEDAPGEWKLGA